MVFRHTPGRAFMLGIFGVFAVAAVALGVTTVAGSGPPLGFAACWLAAFGWNGYWFLLRLAIGLDLTAEALRWESPLRSGEIPLVSITRVRPIRILWGAVVIEHHGGRPLLVMAAKGLSPLFAELARLRPDLDVRPGLYAGLAERLPGRAAWRQQV